MTVNHRRRQLARCVIEISSTQSLFSMSMEKNTVHLVPELIRAINRAVSADGTTFEQYLDRAEQTFRIGNQRNGGRRAVVPPGSGIHRTVREVIANELPFQAGKSPVEIRWVDLGNEDFFEVDRANGVLQLNKRYRHMLLAGRRGGLSDLPLLKALMYLLTEDIFQGVAYGPRDKDNVRLWQAILTTAVQAEQK